MLLSGLKMSIICDSYSYNSFLASDAAGDLMGTDREQGMHTAVSHQHNSPVSSDMLHSSSGQKAIAVCGIRAHNEVALQNQRRSKSVDWETRSLSLSVTLDHKANSVKRNLSLDAFGAGKIHTVNVNGLTRLLAFGEKICSRTMVVANKCAFNKAENCMHFISHFFKIFFVKSCNVWLS